MKLTINNGSTVLFPGDLNKTVGAHLSGDERMQAKFLKMPHHGLAGIAPNSFFETVNPKFVLVPGPKHLWCSSRGNQARQWVASRQVPTWVNGINGNIMVEFKPDETIISSERAEGECESAYDEQAPQ
jgi:beta-lactamase superfamily II metal-dependent hydrolase